MARMVFGTEEVSKITGTGFFGIAKDYLNHYQSEVGNENGELAKRLMFSTTKTLIEKNDTMRLGFINEIEKLSGVQFGKNGAISDRVFLMNPTVKWAAFAIINTLIDMILPDGLISQVGLFSDIRFGAYGDTFSFEKRSNDLYTVYKNGENRKHLELQKDYNKTLTLNPEEFAVTTQVDLYKVITGVESLARFVLKASYSIETEMSYQAYTALDTAFAGLATTGDATLKYVGFNETNLLKLCETVEAWNQGAKPVIAGTIVSLTQVMPSNGDTVRVQINSPYVSQGYIPVFKGYNLFKLDQKADYTKPYALKLNDNALYVFSPSSDKIVKIAVEGSTMTRVDDTYANADLSQSATICKRWAIGVITNSIGGLMTLT